MLTAYNLKGRGNFSKVEKEKNEEEKKGCSSVIINSHVYGFFELYNKRSLPK